MIIPEIKGNNGELYSDFNFYKKGGMGEIYRGIESETKQEIVLKLILIHDPAEEDLLMREIDISTKFSNSNVVTAKLTGKIEISGNNYLFMIQKFYKNGNLRTKIKKNIPIDTCLSMMYDILNGMKVVHEFIVHRDLKPENILIDSDGRLLITDFGLAKYIDEKTKTRTFKGAGTVPYMAPECWTGDKNTISMDIYSLGLMFFEILTGNWPFEASNELEWRNCHLFSSIPDISTLRSDVNIKLKQIIQKMTNKRTNERYSNIDEIINTLNDAIKLNTSEKQDADRLASLGNSIIQQKKAQNLKRAKNEEKIQDLKTSLYFNIDELLSKIINKANEINERLEEEKILIKQHSQVNNTDDKRLTLSFNRKGIVINFTSYNTVDLNEKNIKEQSINFQKKRHGFALQQPQNSFFIKNDIVLVGLAETNFKIGESEFGFNLLLKKQKDSNYGDWFKMQFSKNTTPPKTKFGIDLNNYFEQYSKFEHHPMYTTKFQELSDRDITELFEKIMI